MYGPGDRFSQTKCLSTPGTGEEVAPDNSPAPSALVWHVSTGGTAILSPTPSVYVMGGLTGKLLVQGTIPNDAVDGDELTGFVVAYVGGTKYSVPLDTIRVTDRAGFALTAAYDPAKTAAPTAAEIAAEVNTITLDSGTVSASPAPTTTTFTATGASLNATTDSYNGMSVLFTSGANAGIKRTVEDYASGAFTLSSALPAAPSSGDSFVIA